MKETVFITGGVRLTGTENRSKISYLRHDRVCQKFKDWPIDAPRFAQNVTVGKPRVAHFEGSKWVSECVAAALADASLSEADVIGSRTGFVSGSCFGAAEFLNSLHQTVETKGPRKLRPTDFAIATQGYPTAALSMEYQANGPCTAFVNGATSGYEALSFASLMLTEGQAERMVVLAYDTKGAACEKLQDAAYGTNIPEFSVVAFVLQTTSATLPIAKLGDISSGFGESFVKSDKFRPEYQALDKTRPGSGGLNAIFDILSGATPGMPLQATVQDRNSAYFNIEFSRISRATWADAVA